jgi:hypothetical protein
LDAIVSPNATLAGPIAAGKTIYAVGVRAIPLFLMFTPIHLFSLASAPAKLLNRFQPRFPDAGPVGVGIESFILTPPR